ncbi:MAG: TVP38/TMEM64 family protein [Acidobacteria bacterium]|nr:TVP38/TMEM64 family protein [Acidobacteriota bacterium]
MEADAEGADGRNASWWRPVVLLAVITTIFVLGHLFGLGDRLGAFRDWIRSLGAWGPAAFVLLYAAAAVAAIPGSLLTVAAGALFGTLLGVLLVSIASTLGASLAFLTARYFARDAVTRWLSGNEKFRQIDQLTARRGAIIVGLTRLVPLLPFDLLNYAFGLTNIPFRTYVFWSWLCMLPGTVLYVAGTDALLSGIAQRAIPWGTIATLAIAAVVVAVLVRYARRRLNQSERSKT